MATEDGGTEVLLVAGGYPAIRLSVWTPLLILTSQPTT